VRAIARRLQRLEKRFALVVEAGSTEDSPAARIRARILARGVPVHPLATPETLAKYRGMSLSQVLNFDRNERWRQVNLEKIAGLLLPVAPAADGP
jgi:prephenate dehydrogenase